MEQIASGVNTLNTISGKINEKEPTVLYSLEKLISVGLIEKRNVSQKKKQKENTICSKRLYVQILVRIYPKSNQCN